MVLSLSCQVGISPRKESRPVDKDKADQSETRDYYADSASRAITKRAMGSLTMGKKCLRGGHFRAFRKVARMARRDQFESRRLLPDA
jgi:hypothetical protein